MAKAQADQKAAEMKVAEKKIRARGITKPKHVPHSGTDTGHVQVTDSEGAGRRHATEDRRHESRREYDTATTEGVDTTTDGVVNSGFSIFNQQEQNPMSDTEVTADQTTDTQTEQPVSNASEAQAAKEAAVKAKIEAKAKRLAEAEERKAKREAEKAATEARKAERAAAAAANKEQREKLAAELAESGRKYTGSMLALAERVKAGVYVKSMTGQLRSTDELAVALDAVPPANVVKLGTILFEEANKYASLNVGQQSMNYRNRMRGAIKAGKFTLDQLREVRDAHGLATAEAEIAAKAEAKAAKDAERAAAKAAKEAAAKAEPAVEAAEQTEHADASA